PDHNQAAYEYNLYMGVFTGFMQATNSAILQTLYALDDGAQLRIAWTGAPNTSQRNSLYYLQGGTAIGGAIPCNNMTCDFVHAVPDPTLNTRYLAICDVGTTVRSVVRFKTTDNTCETILDGATLPNKMLRRLAVEQ